MGSLRDRWLAAMRTSTTRAIGREVDYAMSEGDSDKFDPLGLLVWLAFAGSAFVPCEHGAYVPRQIVESLVFDVGFPPQHLYTLALMNDEGMSWSDMATWVERMCKVAA